jgi:hypothetical protein
VRIKLKQCSYCDKHFKKLTREHVVNKSLIKSNYDAGKGYLKALDRHSKDYQTIQDVCPDCNNKILSHYDEYFLTFHENNLPDDFIDEGIEHIIKYDFGDLSRWLLKTLYNSERKNGYNFIPKKMHMFKNYITKKDNRTKRFKIFIELMKDIPKENLKKYGNISEDEFALTRNNLKVGNIFLPELLKLNAIVKYITTSNFVFYIFILGSKNSKGKQFQDILNIIYDKMKTNKIFYLDPKKDSISLESSGNTIIDLFKSTMEGNIPMIDRYLKNTTANTP